jgi:DNA-binding Xre family transcriptional regulator
MSKQQYLKLITTEIEKINREIDRKIIAGKEYRRESEIHKQLLHKIRQHSRKGIEARILNSLNRFPIFANL